MGQYFSTASDELKNLEDAYPELGPLRECMGSLDALSKFTLPIDADNHVRLFRARSDR